MKLGKPLATGVVQEQRVVTSSESEREVGGTSGASVRGTGTDGLPAVEEAPPVVARR